VVPKRRLLPGSGRSGRDAVSVQVITYAPTVFTHCQHCEVAFGEVGLGERVRRDEAASALPPDLALDFAKLSDWVRDIVDRHAARIHVEVIDAASVEGMLASIRNRVWRYPAVVVDGEAMRIGGDYAVADPAIERAIERHGGPLERASARASNERLPSA
jgi:hypothetical protein